MSQLTIHLLGTPGIARDGAPVAMDTRKATALLAYLAVTGRSHAREALAALLWPEYDDEHARSALRRTLSTLRAALDAPHLVIDRDTVSLIPGAGLWVDVAEFRARLAACRTHGHPAADVCHACLAPLAEAAALYRDDFLAGFTLATAPSSTTGSSSRLKRCAGSWPRRWRSWRAARAPVGTSPVRWLRPDAGWRWIPCARRRTARSCGSTPGPTSATPPFTSTASAFASWSRSWASRRWPRPPSCTRRSRATGWRCPQTLRVFENP